MELSGDFKAFLKKLKDDDYVGLGNPRAEILFVGKELKGKLGSCLEQGAKKHWFIEGRAEKYADCRTYHKIHRGRTWGKYQDLFERITLSKKASDKPTFVENVFTTELSDLSAETTVEAKNHPEFEKRLEKRKENFWKHGFIQKQFRIILIFAMDNTYLEKYDGEVVKLFGVPFKKPIEIQGHKLFLHYTEKGDENHPKLLIHTRQLVGRGVVAGLGELVEKIAEIVRDFAKENNIEIIKAKNSESSSDF